MKRPPSPNNNDPNIINPPKKAASLQVITSTSSSINIIAPQACAACRYQRRRCEPDCPLAPYFPPNLQQDFLNAHRLFGLSNILKLLKNVDPHLRHAAVNTIRFQANVRANDPVGGCYRIITNLCAKIKALWQEMEAVRRQIAQCRRALTPNYSHDLHHDQFSSTLQHSSYNNIDQTNYLINTAHFQNNYYILESQLNHHGRLGLLSDLIKNIGSCSNSSSSQSSLLGRLNMTPSDNCINTTPNMHNQTQLYSSPGNLVLREEEIGSVPVPRLLHQDFKGAEASSSSSSIEMEAHEAHGNV